METLGCVFGSATFLLFKSGGFFKDSDVWMAAPRFNDLGETGGYEMPCLDTGDLHLLRVVVTSAGAASRGEVVSVMVAVVGETRLGRD